MECPYCSQELIDHASFGYLASHQSGEVIGDIYKCGNENCEAFDRHFYTYKDNDNLIEDYPC